MNPEQQLKSIRGFTRFVEGAIIALTRRVVMLPLSILLILAVLVVTGIGLALVLSRRTSKIMAGDIRSVALAEKTPVRKLTFEATLVFDGTTADGIRFADQTYQASDCVMLTKRVEFLNSPNSARFELQKRLKIATETFQQGAKRDADGKPVGERAVVILREDAIGPPVSVVMWTVKSEFHSIESSSLQHVIELENWLDSGPHPVSTEKKSSSDLKFEPTAEFKGVSKDGTAFLERQFKSTDCVTLSSRIEYCASGVHAEAKLQARVKDAVEVLERGRKIGVNGEKTGERFVGIFAPELPNEVTHTAEVIWVQDSELHTIRASSLRHVLAFEKSLGP